MPATTYTLGDAAFDLERALGEVHSVEGKLEQFENGSPGRSALRLAYKGTELLMLARQVLEGTRDAVTDEQIDTLDLPLWMIDPTNEYPSAKNLATLMRLLAETPHDCMG